jgi:hypothetical protein
MKQFWRKLVGKLGDSIGKALLGMACVHKLGMSPMEADNFFGVAQSRQEEARFMAGVSPLKRKKSC